MAIQVRTFSSTAPNTVVHPEAVSMGVDEGHLIVRAGRTDARVAGRVVAIYSPGHWTDAVVDPES